MATQITAVALERRAIFLDIKLVANLKKTVGHGSVLVTITALLVRDSDSGYRLILPTSINCTVSSLLRISSHHCVTFHLNTLVDRPSHVLSRVPCKVARWCNG